MNKNLQRLAEQATRKYDRLGSEIPFAQPDLELFAKSIAQECAVLVQTCVDHRIPASEYPNLIREHFGVE